MEWWQMALYILFLLIGMVLLVKGADWFVDGASNIAKALKVPSLVIGLTLVSLGTTAPEAAVSITSAINQNVEMSVGNVVGSSIFNTLFILGLAAMIMPMAINPDVKKYDIPIMLIIYGMLTLFCFVITPGIIQRWEAAVQFGLFISYMVFLFARSKGEKADEPELLEEEMPMPIWKAVLLLVVGLAAIITGGTFAVDCAEVLALEWGMNESLVGLTILAVGTSLPELVTSIVASIKKENDIAVGNVIGASILNVSFILGVSAMITPHALAPDAWLIVGMLIFSGVFMLLISQFFGRMRRWQGAVMFSAYVVFVVLLVLQDYDVISLIA